MRPIQLDRRTFLRGAAGIAVGLPMLEAMLPRTAKAGGATQAKRFVISWGGISLAGYGVGGRVVPAETGPNYTVTRGLQPLEDLGITDKVSIVSGLLLPWAEGASMPPAGRSIEFHYNTIAPQISGTVSGEQQGSSWVRTGNGAVPKGPTADHLVANSISTPDQVFSVLAYRVQPASYLGTNQINGNVGRMSWRDNGGELQAVDPIVNPLSAYQSLFTGFTPPDPVEAAAAELLLRRNQSVLDIVERRADGLVGRLGAADRQRIEQHLYEIRELEKRLKALQPDIVGCELLPEPEEFPIGDAIIEYNGNGMPYSTSAGYSNEVGRSDVLADLIRMAFICDRSRVASLMMTEWKCYMNMFNFGGWQSDMHELTHGAGPEDSVADAVGFHLRLFGGLVAKLRDTPELEGSMLDNTALVLVLEGGWGYDPETGSSGSTHSTENMACFIAGGAGGLRQGEHIRAVNKHPGQVVLTAMRAVGHQGDLGDLSEDLDELRV